MKSSSFAADGGEVVFVSIARRIRSCALIARQSRPVRNDATTAASGTPSIRPRNPGEARGDGAIRASVTQAILAEPALRDYMSHVYHKGIMETLRAPPGGPLDERELVPEV